MPRLTRRQQQFLHKFLDLYNKDREPLHYSVLARHLGVNKVSAYEMLRLLEGHGLVEAEYQLPAHLRGPGRAQVVFRPTPLAAKEIARLASEEADQPEWDRVRTHIIEQLEAGKAGDYAALLEELLARTPKRNPSLIYVAEMITAVVLGVESLRDTAEAHALGDTLAAIAKAGESGLGVFAGLGMGLSAAGRINRRLSDFLLTQSGRLQSALAQLSDENRRRLAQFTREAMQIVGE